MEEIVSKEHLTEILNSHKFVIVDIYGTFCGPCKAIAPYLNSLSERVASYVKIVKENVELNLHEDTVAVPTFLFYINGVQIDECKGANKNILKMWVDHAVEKPTENST